VPTTTIQIDSTDDRTQSWRHEIVKARIRLTDRDLSRDQRADLWRIVDFREWCLRITVSDFHAELEKIDREIEAELRQKKIA
jgi:hypothetical protein